MKTLLATAAALTLATSASAAVTLQANNDTWLRNDSGGSGAINGAMNRLEFRQLDGVRARHALFSFDLSGVSGDLSGAFIILHAADPSDGISSDPINRDRDIKFFGVNDGAANEAFDELATSYSNAPGFTGPLDDGFHHFSADMNPAELGVFNTDTDVYGDYATAPTAALDAHIAADTNDVVTFTAQLQDGGGSAHFFFHSKEFNGSTGPRLVLPNAVPEPTSLALLGLGGLLAARRRRG